MKTSNSLLAEAQSASGSFTQGLVGAVALGSLMSTRGGTVTGAVTVAIGMGIAAAVFGVAHDLLKLVAGSFYFLLGVCAFIPTAVTFFRSNGCLHGPPPELRFAGVALLAAVAGVTFGAGFVVSRRLPALTTGLAVFGALQILITASTFISGAGSSSPNSLALAVMVPGAAILGWCAVSVNKVVVNLAAFAFGLQAIYAAAVEPGCGGMNFSGVVLIVVFAAAYFAVRAVCAPFAPRR
jgi:hypothetical protein